VRNLWHDTFHYYDVANNAALAGSNAAFDHVYSQFSVCLVICASINAQGSSLYASVQGFSITRSFEKKLTPSYFIGWSVGVNSATSQEAMQNNLTFGGCYADGVGGCAGVSTNVSSRGPSGLRPYGGVTIGAGFQAGGGPDHTWNWSGLIPNLGW
jgi:hypothetical protein